MRSNFAVAFGAGLVIIAIVIGGIFFMQRNDKIDLPGKIMKVRTAVLDDGKSDRGPDHPATSEAVIDFRVSNPSDVLFEVRTVTVRMEGSDGKRYEGQVASDGDAERLMQALPALGEKYNKTLMMRERINAHASQDRMVAARFEMPLDEMEGRKRFIVRIEEVDGKVFEYSEK